MHPRILDLFSNWTIIIKQRVPVAKFAFFTSDNQRFINCAILDNSVIMLKWHSNNQFLLSSCKTITVMTGLFLCLVEKSFKDIASKPININFINILCLCVMSLENQTYLFYLLGSKALKCSLLTPKICNIFLTTAVLFTNR